VTNATPTSAGAFYVVQRGDTLWRIHLRFGVTVYALKVANGLRSNLIYVGQVLVIPDGTPPTTTGDTEVLAQVVNVVDGDTIDVNWDGATYRVRYIGVNTPESNEPCFAEATSANATLVSGQTVKLVKDISETDRFGRLLRYVYAGDRFVNAELVAQGYAEALAYPPDTTHANYFESLEAQARAANLACYTTGVFGDTIGPSPTQAPANCDPAYPTVCIPSPPPDLNCPDVGYTDFTVLAPDPHNFDGDGDGIGCET
jgi:micrococcal nuclease